ncbi:hypothetical protein AMTR_s00181p00033640 [Amborella trichopoda]|uniref:Uncharacterized protein n=1 Tax=Amborella trichopoda TaxID=13333 RepID=W1P533_AMBTC|nr:hypothetical protein AMTR_s00181p00033640 [Amborella trichopoda]
MLTELGASGEVTELVLSQNRESVLCPWNLSILSENWLVKEPGNLDWPDSLVPTPPLCAMGEPAGLGKAQKAVE